MLHVSGNSYNISTILIYCLISISLRIWKKWQCKDCTYCCSLNCKRNLCSVNYITLTYSHQNNQRLLVHDRRCLVSHWASSISVWDSDDNLRGTPCGGRKKPNLGRSPIGLLSTADVNSHLPCRSHAVLCWALRSRFQNGMAGARHGHGMVCVNQTWPHCLNQIGNKQSKPLATRHGRGMVCVN